MLFLVVRLLQFDCFVALASGLRAAAAQAADAARTNPTEDKTFSKWINSVPVRSAYDFREFAYAAC